MKPLLYARNAVGDDPKRLGILQAFFQMLTQAASRVDRTALVASLITSDIVLDDPTGVQVLDAIGGVFRRIGETVEPVSQEDISELLRRRLFEEVPPEGTRRAVVDSLAGAMQKLPLRDSQKDQAAHDRLLRSYPFHPDLLDVFYQKWTQLDKLQRTRGILRMFATALKASDGKDPSPFVGPNTLLGPNGELSEAVRELIEACDEAISGPKFSPASSKKRVRFRQVFHCSQPEKLKGRYFPLSYTHSRLDRKRMWGISTFCWHTQISTRFQWRRDFLSGERSPGSSERIEIFGRWDNAQSH